MSLFTKKLALASRYGTLLAVAVLTKLTAAGTAALPVVLPITLFAARLAIFASVTAPAAMVVDTVLTVEVTSPVKAGILAVGSVPDVISLASICLFVSI